VVFVGTQLSLSRVNSLRPQQLIVPHWYVLHCHEWELEEAGCSCTKVSFSARGWLFSAIEKRASLRIATSKRKEDNDS
jgi:hypothetical protein